MCKCTPEIRTPFCGKPGCQWPHETRQVLITLVHIDGAKVTFVTDPGSTYGVTAIGYAFRSLNKHYMVHPKRYLMILDEEINPV